MNLQFRGKNIVMSAGAHCFGLESLKLFAAKGADAALISRNEAKIATAVSTIDAARRQVVNPI